MFEVASDYAAHFYEMFINKCEGKHMTGHCIQVGILLLSIQFLLQDLQGLLLRRYGSFIFQLMNSNRKEKNE